MRDIITPNLKNIVIFGASSFLGRNLRKKFATANVTVFAVFRTLSDNAGPKLTNYEHHVYFDGGIESLSALASLSKESTVVINCCGLSGLPDEIERMSSIIEANMGMTSKILQFMTTFSFVKLIITESYWQFDEFGSESGKTLYAVAKNMQTLLVRYFSSKYGISTAGLVLYDVYGESDVRSKLLDQLAKSIALNQAIDLTNGDQFVDFVHISDVVEAYRLVAKNLVDSELSASPGFTRFYIRSGEPLMTLKSRISQTLSSLNYDSKLNWGARPFSDHQIYRLYWPKADLLVPNWQCKVLFEQGLKALIRKYET